MSIPVPFIPPRPRKTISLFSFLHGCNSYICFLIGKVFFPSSFFEDFFVFDFLKLERDNAEVSFFLAFIPHGDL